ncbi:UDP-N-acetylglucosamine 1-carboxyvinyltransferase, partial [Pelistega indica]
MDKLKIIGGTPLHGEITISGAKNAALPILCAVLLTDEPIILRNVPDLNDVKTTIRVLEQLGVKVEWLEPEVVRLQADNIISYEAPYELVKTMRASILVLGPLLTRFGQAKVSLPGGCAIGQRPVDQHIKGLEALSADIKVEHGFVVAKAERLQGASIRTDMVTVGGTEQFLMSAALAKGTTILENAAREPEVVDLAELLIAMGAKITGHGSDRIIIEGVDKLHGTDYTVVADRIEAGTFLCAVGAAGGDITLRKAAPHTMGATLDKLIEAGLTIETGADWIRARMDKRPKAVSIKTHEHPGFATDMQAQMMALNTISDGTSVIVENIFENRYMHA